MTIALDAARAPTCQSTRKHKTPSGLRVNRSMQPPAATVRGRTGFQAAGNPFLLPIGHIRKHHSHVVLWRGRLTQSGIFMTGQTQLRSLFNLKPPGA